MEPDYLKLLQEIVDLVEIHKCTCFSCDRDGEMYCSCLQQKIKEVKDFIANPER